MVAQRYEKRNSRAEIVPNTFGGVNTHLLRIDAYIVGIVPHSTPFYTVPREARRPGNPESVGVLSGKRKIEMSFSMNLIRCWR
jgi:hypothetical protein